MYADYEFYVLHGFELVPEEKYDFVSQKASHAIDYYTFNRIERDKITKRIKLCHCELCDFFYALEQEAESQKLVDGKGPVKSESVDNWSASYGTSQIPQMYTNSATGGGIDGMIRNICLKYLTAPVNLMYVGLE